MEHLDPPTAHMMISAPFPLRERIAQAASRRGIPLDLFIMNAASQEADSVLEEVLPLRLTEEDAQCILGLLDNPPPPNAMLTRAFARRNELFSAGH